MTETSAQQGHPIQVAARRSGLTQDVIRIWERRYGAVTPLRTPTNRRVYSDEDVERLLLLARVTRAGRRIGDVASLSLAKLRAMVRGDQEAAARVVAAAAQPTDAVARRHYTAGLEAARRLDSVALRTNLQKAAIELSRPVLFEQVLHPLMTEIGNQWHDGSIRVAHEHLASGIVRTFLGAMQDGVQVSDGAPEILVATPAGQLHELGALMVAVAASADGWRVSYCGANLPAEDIVAAARERSVKAIALSIVYPSDDPYLVDELRRLRSGLGQDTLLIVGGSSAQAYEEILQEIDASVILDIAGVRRELKVLRRDP